MAGDLFAKVGDVIIELDSDGSSGVENVEALLARLIAQRKADAFYTCGSNRLFQLMKRMAKVAGIPGQVAMEQVMACGLGPCYVCVRTFEVDGKKELHRRSGVRSAGGSRMVDMSVKIGSVTLKNPIMPASGCFSTDLAQVIDLNRLGALVAKTVSREFRAGNPPPRVSEVEGGMINSIGLPTKGIEYFLTHQVPDYKRFTPPLVGSISATTIEDFEAMARDVSTSGIDVLEVNISCPTRDPKGGNFALHAEHTFDVMSLIRKTTDKPIWCKLSPNAGDVVAVGQAAEAAGANALVVSNTILGLKIDTNTFKPAIGNKFGGLSGPGIKPIIVRMVYQCAKAVKIPIIGCGGIVKVEDVVEYMLAGASAVMIGYLIFRNPSGMIAIIEELEQWCAKRGFARVADLTGAMIDEAPRETYAAAAAPIG
jgi:dihydroorotate dehydrogenase (NAD+) catalytic subunit